MIKRLHLLIAFLFLFVLLIASSATAQVTAQPGQNLKWDQATAEIATVGRFEVKIDAGAYVDAGKVLANDAQTQANNQTYRFVIPAITPGPHVFLIRACPVSGSCGPDAAPFNVQMLVLTAPTNVRIGDDGMESEFEH